MQRSPEPCFIPDSGTVRPSMNEFFRILNSFATGENGRSWILVLEDQLSDDIGPLSREDPQGLGVVFIESHWKLKRRPYHKQKVAFHLLNLRHFALEQAKRGVAVRYQTTSEPLRETLKTLIQELGSLRVMEPAELEVRQDLDPLVKRGLVTFIPHEGWLTSRHDFEEGADKKPPWRMDTTSKSPDYPAPDPPGCVPQQPGKTSLDRLAHFR